MCKKPLSTIDRATTWTDSGGWNTTAWVSVSRSWRTAVSTSPRHSSSSWIPSHGKRGAVGPTESRPSLPDQTRSKSRFVSNVCHYSRLYFLTPEHIGNPRFDNVTKRLGYSREPSEFLAVSIEGMLFFIGLFSKEKGTFWLFGPLSPSKSPKSQKVPFFEKTNV